MSSSETVPDLVPPLPPALQPKKTPAPLSPKTKAPQPARHDRGAVTVPPPNTQKIADAGIQAPNIDPAGDETAGDEIDTADSPSPQKQP